MNDNLQMMWNAGSAKQLAPLLGSRCTFGNGATVQHQINNEDEDLQHCCCTLPNVGCFGDRLEETGGFPDELPSSNPWGNPTRSLTQWYDPPPLQETAHCWEVDTMEPSTMVRPCVSHGRKRLLWAERPDGWRCASNAPKKQWKDHVAADVSTHLTRCLYCDPLATVAGMMAERGAWRGLRYDITGIKQRRDDSSEHTHPDATSIDGLSADPIWWMIMKYSSADFCWTSLLYWN